MNKNKRPNNGNQSNYIYKQHDMRNLAVINIRRTE